jgi:Tfp pilus assembly protein PilF
MSVTYATPNACNNCHQDKPAKWAADAVVKWYGPKRKYSYVEDLIPGSRLNNQSEPHLLRLLQDSTTPNIIKATALNYLGATPFPNGMSALMESLSSPDAQIRYEALRSLQAYPKNNMNLGAIAAMLKDKVRAVRIAAADLVSSMGKNIQVPEEYQSAYQLAKAELEKNLLHQADFAHGNIGIADHYQRNGEFASAEKFYLRALKKDSLANLARLNLAVTYNLQGKNQDAIEILQLAAKTDPKNDRAWYNLGLLYNELKDNPNAAMAFEKAIQLNSQNSRLYYNYGLLLQQMNKAEKAAQVLEQGLKSYPQEESLHYALAYVYLQNSRSDKARTHVMFLKQVNPNNPEYQQLFSSLGIR